MLYSATKTEVRTSATSGTPMLMVSAESEDLKAKALGINGTVVARVGFLRFKTIQEAQAAHDKIAAEGLISKISLKESADVNNTLCDVVFN